MLSSSFSDFLYELIVLGCLAWANFFSEPLPYNKISAKIILMRRNHSRKLLKEGTGTRRSSARFGRRKMQLSARAQYGGGIPITYWIYRFKYFLQREVPYDGPKFLFYYDGPKYTPPIEISSTLPSKSLNPIPLTGP